MGEGGRGVPDGWLVVGGGRCALEVHGFAQGLAGFEMRHPLFGDVDRFTAAGIAANARRAAGHGEAAKATDLDALAMHQGIAHGILDGFDGVLGIALCELGKTCGQLFN